jgi:hypothetical protein
MIDGEMYKLNVRTSSIDEASPDGSPTRLRVVCDRYRCPERFAEFRPKEELSSKLGYFEFGPGTICYGRSTSGSEKAHPGLSPSDPLARPGIDRSQLVLPFDPNEVIDNLLLERYPASYSGTFENLLKRIYYWFRPVTTLWMRKYIQRFHAGNWEQSRFPKWPVDTTVESICENLLLLSLRASGVERIPFIWFWPDGAQGCVLMTHDVEAEEGRDFCEQLMEIDDSFGIKASFQIVPEDRYSVTAEFIRRIRDRGFEVCVQDLNHDGRLFDRREEFLRRVALINDYCREYGANGYRSAVLYRKPEWYKNFAFSFDMSFPNVAHLDPQRGGCCTVMPYFIGDVLELPLTTIQDYTLFHVLKDHSIDLWKKQIEMILAKNGLVTFIVHPDYIVESEPQSVYKQLLALLSELRGRESLWFALPSEIDHWWRARSHMSIVERDGSWVIMGEGAERAVLAFAREVDGKLVYEVPAWSNGKPQGSASFSSEKR